MKHSRLPLIFVISVLVLVAALASGFFLVYEKTSEHQLMAYGQMTLDGAAFYVDTMMEAAKDILDNIYLDADVSMLLNRHDVGASELLSGLRRLYKYVSSSYFIDSIYIYNRAGETVYVSSPHMPEAVYAIKDFPDFDAASIMADYWQVRNMEPLFRSYSAYYPTLQTVPYISFIRYNTLSPKGESNVIMVNLRQDILANLFPSGQTGGGSFLLCDAAGSTVPVAGQIDASISEGLSKTIGGGQESFIYREGGHEFIVCTRRVLGSNAILAFVADEDEIASLSRAYGFASSTLLLALAFAAILVLCIFFLRRIWEGSRVQMEQMRQSEAEKRRLLAENRRGRLLSFLHSLSELEGEEAQSLTDGQSVLVVASIDHYLGDIARRFEKASERNALKESLLEGFASALGPQSVLFSTYEDDERCVLCLAETVTAESLAQAKASLEGEYHISLTLALSDPQMADALPAAYEYLTQALSYRLLLGPGSLITPTLLEEHEMASYEIEDSLLKSLGEAVMALDVERSLSLLDSILSHMAEASYRSCQLCLVSLAVSLDDAFNRIMLNNGIELPFAGALIHRVSKLESLWELHPAVETMLEQIEQALSEKGSNRQGELVAQIVRITKEKYSRQDFSINTVADELGMNAAYLGRVFKKSTGSKFTDFVLKERMEEACRLLATTDEPIDMIVYLVGFSDTPYFYKLFKKLNGCTPLRYRQENRNTPSS